MAAGINLDATQAKLVRAVIGHTLIKTAAAVAACWLGVGPVALYALSAQWASESAWMCYNWNMGAHEFTPMRWAASSLETSFYCVTATAIIPVCLLSSIKHVVAAFTLFLILRTNFNRPFQTE